MTATSNINHTVLDIQVFKIPVLTCFVRLLQIVDPTNTYIVHNSAVSSGDHSFDAKNDGKHVYCFSNENWSASTKEVSFNVHGIVYVPESEAPSDPLEKEGMSKSTSALMWGRSNRSSLYPFEKTLPGRQGLLFRRSIILKQSD